MTGIDTLVMDVLAMARHITAGTECQIIVTAMVVSDNFPVTTTGGEGGETLRATGESLGAALTALCVICAGELRGRVAGLLNITGKLETLLVLHGAAYT